MIKVFDELIEPESYTFNSFEDETLKIAFKRHENAIMSHILSIPLRMKPSPSSFFEMTALPCFQFL